MEIEVFPVDPKNPSSGYTIRFRSLSGEYTEWTAEAETAENICQYAVEKAREEAAKR